MVDFAIFPTSAVACLVALLLPAVWLDVRYDRIPNWLTGSGILAGLVLTIVDGLWWPRLAGVLMGIALGLTLFIAGIAPGGMCKLMIAVGALVGPIPPLLSSLMILPVLGGVWIASRTASRWTNADPNALLFRLRFPGSIVVLASAVASLLFS